MTNISKNNQQKIDINRNTTFGYFYLDFAPFGYSFASKGYKKDVAPEPPDFIGGFAVSTAEKTTSDFVDVKKILFPF